MRLMVVMLGITLMLGVAGCDRFGKHGALIDGDQAPVGGGSTIVEATTEMVAACQFLGEINSRADEIAKGKRNVRLMASDIGATHVVWTASERFDDAALSQRAFVSGKAYRCN